MASADTSVFSFQVGAYPLETFRVIEFIGREAISECFSFTIRAVAYDTEVKFEDGIGVQGVLYIGGADYDITHYGMITAFTHVPDSDGTVAPSHTYEFTVEPRVRVAAYNTRSRIFQNKTVLEILEEVLSDYFSKDTDFKIDCKYEKSGQDYAKREFTVQYNESDLDFIQRLMEDEGIFYFFDQSGDREVLMITNKKEAIQPIANTPTLPFRPETGMHAEAGEYVGGMQQTMRWITGAINVVKDYNYRTPETNVIGVFEQEGATGEYYHFGDHVKTTDEAARLAQIRGEMFKCDREVYRGSSIARSMHCGHRFTLEHSDSFDGEYLVTRVLHKGDVHEVPDDGTVEQSSKSKPHYTNSFECIPAATQFRPRLSTPKPKAPGILTAKVDGQKGSYAYLDEEGRYRMKLFFDRSDDKDGKASKAIRLAQPYAGAGYGMHFPLHTDTEIAVGFVDGDLDRPIGLGAIPNPGKGSPVKAGNKSQNMMKSHSGNTLTLEDKEGSTGIHLTSSGGHTMGFDDADKSKGFSVKTSGGHSLALDDAGKGIKLHTHGGIDIKLDDDGKKVIIDTHGNTITMEDGGNKITIATKAGATIAMEGDAGNIIIDAKTEISLKAVDSSLTLNKDGTINLIGKKVTVNGKESLLLDGGPSATLTSGDTIVKGKTSVNISAAAVTSEAKGINSIKGANIMSEASANNVVKGGAAVMLNPG